jgi:hypothetical protein
MKRALLSAALAASGLIAAPHLVLAQNYQQPYQQPSQQQPYQQPPGPPPGAPPQDDLNAAKQQRLQEIARHMEKLRRMQACVQNAADFTQLQSCHPPKRR